MNKFKHRFTGRFRNQQKGFTLIELLIVITILGILSSVAIPQVTRFIRNGKVAAANAELGLVHTAIAVAMVDANIDTLPGPGGDNPSLKALSPTSDFTVATGYVVSAYIQGGLSSLVGTYTFNSKGIVTTASYPGVTWGTFNFQ